MQKFVNLIAFLQKLISKEHVVQFPDWVQVKKNILCSKLSRGSRGGQVCTLQWSHLCLRNSLKIATRIFQFSQYLETKLDMLFEIATSVEIVMILEKTAILP